MTENQNLQDGFLVQETEKINQWERYEKLIDKGGILMYMYSCENVTVFAFFKFP